MSLISRIGTAARILFGRQTGKRAFNGAQGGRLYADWMAGATSSDAEIRSSFRKLLDRSRDLERNNDYQRGYLGDCEDNIVGSIRQDLRMDCGEYVSGKGKDRAPVWQPDRLANTIIENAWLEWGKRGTCTVCGRYSWRDLKRLAVRTVPRDGNFLARKIYGAASGNRFGFALQIWEIDHLDLNKFQMLSDGSEIRFGIERDPQGRVAAYWMMARHPGDMGGSFMQSTSTRFLASEVYHAFVTERAEQTIGLPWCVSAITRLRQLGAFEEAAVIAARLGASKAGFFKTTGQGEWTGETGADGRAVMSAEPGQFEQMPEGWDLAQWNPEYPNIETSEFRKAMLRGVATSLGTSYTTLGNDLESVNFSSARVGLFDERETWKKHQLFFDECLWEPIFGDWLSTSMTSGAVNLPLSKFEKFNRPRFKGRRWPFIDPLKEIEAAKGAIALRLGSRRQFIEEGGGDVEDVFHDNVEDEKLADDIGLDLSPPPIESTPSAIAAAAAAGSADEAAASAPAKGAKTGG